MEFLTTGNLQDARDKVCRARTSGKIFTNLYVTKLALPSREQTFIVEVFTKNKGNAHDIAF